MNQDVPVYSVTVYEPDPLWAFILITIAAIALSMGGKKS